MLVQSVENKEEGQEGRSYSVKLLEVVTRLRFVTWSQRSSNWVVACPFQAGCVHFPPVPQCDVKVLLLIFSPKKRAFVGLIPVEQVRISFVYVTLHVMKTVWFVFITCDTNFPECFSIQCKFFLLFLFISSVLHWLIPPSKVLFVADDEFDWTVFGLFSLPIIRDSLQLNLTMIRWFTLANPYYVLHTNICGEKSSFFKLATCLTADSVMIIRPKPGVQKLKWTFSLNVLFCTSFTSRKHSCVQLGAQVECL